MRPIFMMTIFKTITLAAVLAVTALPAQSQTLPPYRPGQQPLPEGFINFQSNVTLSLPLIEGQKVEAQTEDAQRVLYTLAAKQCGIALATIAAECQMTNLSTTVNSQRMQRDNPVITVTAQISMAVKLKDTP